MAQNAFFPQLNKSFNVFSDFPAVCVRTMAKISREAEACIWNERAFEDLMRAVRRREREKATLPFSF